MANRERPMHLETYDVRGHAGVRFTDSYGHQCSIQESSNIVPHLWLGVDDAESYTRMHIGIDLARFLRDKLSKFIADEEATADEESDDEEAEYEGEALTEREAAYLDGKRAANLHILRTLLGPGGLDGDSAEHARLALVHGETVAALGKLLDELEIDRAEIHPADLIRRAVRFVTSFKDEKEAWHKRGEELLVQAIGPHDDGRRLAPHAHEHLVSLVGDLIPATDAELLGWRLIRAAKKTRGVSNG